MHIKKENNLLIIYLPNKLFDSNQDVEKYFYTLFSKLKNNYNISISGYCDISIYGDEYYGQVIEIKREEFDYLDSNIEMNIKIKKTNFLYEIDTITNYGTIYKYHNKFYLKLNKKITNNKYYQLLENSNLIYNDLTIKIISKNDVVKNI